MRYRETPSSINPPINTELPVTVYPNPATNKLTIKPRLNYQNLKITILTMLGERILTTTNQTEIDINSIPSGTYFLQIEIDSKTQTKKLLKIE